MSLESKREHLTVVEGSPNLIDHNSSLVVSNTVVDDVVEIKSLEQSGLVAAATPKEVAKEAVRRQLPVYQGCTLMFLCRELMQP